MEAGALATVQAEDAAIKRRVAYVDWLTRLGDQCFAHLLENGDAFTRAMYGEISIAAGMVDGVLNMILQRNEIEPCADGVFLELVAETKEHVTTPILQGQYPRVRSAAECMFNDKGIGIDVTCAETGLPTGYRIMHVREARIILHSWVLHSIVDEQEFANWLADNSKDRERFREWFDLTRRSMDLHLRGCRQGDINAHDKATTLAMMRTLNHELATYYLIMVEQ